MKLEIGQVLWRMSGTRQNDKITWHAYPLCIERLTDHSFHSASGTGGSFGLIGKSYFLSRQEALDNWLKTHDSFETPIPIDQELTAEQKEIITEHPRTDWNDHVIYKQNSVNSCGVYVGGLNRLKDITELLVWNSYKDSKYRYFEEKLTLREIFKQVCSGTGQFTGYESAVITVIQYDPLQTAIYQCNNYEHGLWVKLGEVMGYA